MPQMDHLTSALFGKTRRALLALFYSHPDETFYLWQVIRAVSLGRGTVKLPVNPTITGPSKP
jgi:hypothetical protein